MDFTTHHHTPPSPYLYRHPVMQQHADQTRTGTSTFCPGAEAEAFPIGAQQTWSTSQAQHPPPPTEPLSLFAQTLKELDDKFYATFPAAKQAAIERWQLRQAQTSPTFDIDYCVEAIYDPQTCQPYTHHHEYTTTNDELNTHYHSPTYAPTPTPSSLQPRPHVVSYGDEHQLVPPATPTTTSTLTPDSIVPSNRIMPTQRGLDTQAGVISVRRSVDREAPPSSPPDSGQFIHSPSSYADSPPSLGSPFVEDDAFIQRRHSHEATSEQWPTAQRAIAPATRHLSLEETIVDVDPPHVKSESPPHSPAGPRSLRRHTRSHPPSHNHPYAHVSKHVIRPLPYRYSMSPQRLDSPPPKRAGESKKPPLACLFCRGRKIACGPPLPGSKTCNQCQRRSLTCEYPLESRRGMRKKKNLPSLNSDGPKVTVTKRITTLP